MDDERDGKADKQFVKVVTFVVIIFLTGVVILDKIKNTQYEHKQNDYNQSQSMNQYSAAVVVTEDGREIVLGSMGNLIPIKEKISHILIWGTGRRLGWNFRVIISDKIHPIMNFR